MIIGSSILENGFEKIRLKNCLLYIHKNFRNNNLKKSLLTGEKELLACYQLTIIPSSKFARVYKFVVRFDDGDRGVYFKRYLSRSVGDFIKHLVRPGRARRALKAAGMLAENGFEVPVVIAIGEFRSGFFNKEDFLVTLEVRNAKQIYQIVPESLGSSTDEQLRGKRELIRKFGRTIGRMHARGIFHGDLRLGNVLAKRENDNWRFFFLDNERTRKFRRLPARLRLKNLVQLNLTSPNLLTNTDRMRFFKEYWAQSGNGKSKKQKIALIKKIVRRTNRRLSQKSRGGSKLRKSLQTNARYLRIKTSKYLAVFDRSFCAETGPLNFMEQIDALMDKGQILKKDNTSYVSRLMWNDSDIVVKRYNHKGFTHSLRHTIKGSRARRAWLYAHRLMILQIATPKPLAYIEQRKGLLVWKSYLVTEYVDGQKLYHFLRNGSVTHQQRSAATRQIMDLLNHLGQYRITHGDLKHTNILITENGPVLTDLDAMKRHKWHWMYRYRQKKDLTRFG